MTGTTTSLIGQVLEHRLDGAFVSGPVNHQELDEESISLERLVLISPLSIQNLDELAHVEKLKTIVFRKDCSFRQRLSSILQARGLAHQVLEFDSLDAVVTCLSAGVGITLLPEPLVNGIWKDRPVAIHSIPQDLEWIEVVFARRRDHAVTSALKSFLKMIQQISNQPRSSQHS